MMEIYCAFSGSNWTKAFFDDITNAQAYLELLRPADSRPSHILLVNCTHFLYEYTQGILWTPQILIETNGQLHGGLTGTRLYFQRFLDKIKTNAKPIT
jgi:hypothetical protein